MRTYLISRNLERFSYFSQRCGEEKTEDGLLAEAEQGIKESLVYSPIDLGGKVAPPLLIVGNRKGETKQDPEERRINSLIVSPLMIRGARVVLGKLAGREARFLRVVALGVSARSNRKKTRR